MAEQRKREYISPSSLALFYQDPELHYCRYISPHKPPDYPQTQPMAVGSAFDAYVKNFLHERLFGVGKDPKFAFEALFEAQVEPHQRDWARPHGLYCFEQYKSAGCLTDLLTELQHAQGEPRFEFDLLGAVEGEREAVEKTLCKVPFLGKPDCHYHNNRGGSVIVDFKVNGYCSPSGQSPKPGYMKMRSAGKFDHGMHKKCHPMMHNGVMVNVANRLNDVDEGWAAQTSIYGWLLGEPIGGDFVVGIDQLACDPKKSNPPAIRIAQHRTMVDRQYQIDLFYRAAHCWEVINSDHQLRHLSKEDSQARCETLDNLAATMRNATAPDEQWLMAISRM